MSAKRKRQPSEEKKKKKTPPVVASEFVPAPPLVYKAISLRRYPELYEELLVARNACSAMVDIFDAAIDNDKHSIVFETTTEQLCRQWQKAQSDVGNAVLRLSAASTGLITPQDIPL